MPAGQNWSGVCQPGRQEMLDNATQTFNEAERDVLLARIHEHVVDDACRIWVVQDIKARALRPEAQGFFQAKSWHQDLTRVYVRC